MSRANIPRPDSAAAAWMRNFARGLSEGAEVYHVSPEQAAEVTTAVNAFRSTLAISTPRRTRTMVAVVNKNAARADAERICRRFYTNVRGDPRIGDGDKLAIGVRPVKGHRSRSKPPTTRPVLRVMTTSVGHELRWNDEAARSRIGKPAGSAMLQLFVAVGPQRIDAPSAARLVNVYTGNRTTLIRNGLPGHVNRADAPGQAVEDDEAAHAGMAGQFATFFARWAGPTGQPGPWSAPASVRLAA